jgi:hypothetical protein
VIPLDARAVQAAAVGLDFLSSGDHNHITDYGPTIAARKLSDWLASGRGYELTTQRWGHFSVFPLPATAAGRRHHELPVRGPSAQRFFAGLRAIDPDMVVMVNHPLSRQDSYFRNGGLDLELARGRAGFSFAFDAMEILNGYEPGNYRQLNGHLRLWFDLLDHGHMVTAVGNSDSHELRSRRGLAGYPRNWVQVDDDRPAALTGAHIARGVKSRRVVTSTGPFLWVGLERGMAGDLVRLPGGRGRLVILVQAAPWVSVARVVVYVDGGLDRLYQVPASREVTRFHVAHELALARDAHVVVRVDGDRPLPPIAGDADAPIPSMAVANPIYVDVDGNGRFDPSRRRPLSPVARSGTR